jgi:hypothetical protein
VTQTLSPLSPLTFTLSKPNISQCQIHFSQTSLKPIRLTPTTLPNCQVSSPSPLLITFGVSRTEFVYQTALLYGLGFFKSSTMHQLLAIQAMRKLYKPWPTGSGGPVCLAP